jgi:hypothetical protein
LKGQPRKQSRLTGAGLADDVRVPVSQILGKENREDMLRHLVPDLQPILESWPLLSVLFELFGRAHLLFFPFDLFFELDSAANIGGPTSKLYGSWGLDSDRLEIMPDRVDCLWH